ncbi:MAG: serine/threonine protein kinase [Planctomycetes bacterium]|nr:serine/threonine protein kinase [Planctomycetota bacterium]
MRIGRYEVLGEVARGGFGVVLRARDPALSREVAIKLLLAGAGASDTQRRRFEREVGALARLRHPNIVSVHEAGSIREGPYIVMDFVDGESLDQRLARLGPLPVREALRLMETVARAIEHAHTRGVLHRDLKPGNVLVDRTGTPLVTDFGLAREVDPRLSATALSRSGASLGTPGYWPPEQAYGRLADIGPRSDVYALGATLYALLTGQPPYEAPSIVELMGRMTAPPTPPSALRPEVPPALDAVVLRALAAEPAERHATAGALADALAECRRRSRAPPARASRSRSPSSAPPRWRRR